MSDLKAKMHVNRFWLGLRPRPHWDLTVLLPQTLAGIKGTYFWRNGGTGKKGDER